MACRVDRKAGSDVVCGYPIWAMLMTEHNLHFYQQLMGALRAAIADHRLTAFATDFRGRYARK